MPVRKIRPDFPIYELRGATIRKARKEYECDSLECYERNGAVHPIPRFAHYAYVSTGLRFCELHYLPDDIVSVPTPSEASNG